MMGLFTAIRFDRPVPMQASSLARLPTLRALLDWKSLPRNDRPISDVSASLRRSPCDEEAAALASPSGTNDPAPSSVHSLCRYRSPCEKRPVQFDPLA